MKKYKIIFLLLTGVFAVNSCNDSDLELSDPNQITPDTYFANEAQVQAAVNAAYANLQTVALYGRLIWYMMDNMSQENQDNPQMEPDKRTFKEFTFNSTNGEIRDYWDSCFRGINKANFVIGNAAIIDGIPEQKLSNTNRLKFYAEARFLRAQYYFMLVNRFGNVPLRNGDFTQPEGKAISPKADVVSLIIEDLEYASIHLLPKASEEKGRANKEETEHGIESVWEVQYDLTLGTGAKWDGPVVGAGQNHATFRGQDYGNLNWFNSYPSDDLFDSYEAGDNRLNGTMYFVGDSYNNGNNIFTAAQFTAESEVKPRVWKKYQNYYKQTDEAQESGINAKVIRYADVLLMMAECENERPGGSQSVAVGYINRVRDRADLDFLPTTLSKSQVFEAIVQERKVELAGEQVRFDDLVRWGRAATFLAGTGFQAGKHELWPIPDQEISSNPNVTSDDQNPGY